MSIATNGRRLTRLALATFVALFGLAAYSSLAHAACSYPDAAQVFSPWKDKAYYQLAPEGGLEAGASGWTLEGGAMLVTDQDHRFPEEEMEETAVALPFGASATSPPVCVDETTPSFRFMARNVGDKGAKLRVTITYENTKKVTKAKNSDIHTDENEWEPTQSLKLETGDEGERVARITFTGKDPKSDYLVDDVYVDPFARH
jgi:hypothetical protein